MSRDIGTLLSVYNSGEQRRTTLIVGDIVVKLGLNHCGQLMWIVQAPKSVKIKWDGPSTQKEDEDAEQIKASYYLGKKLLKRGDHGN